MWPPHQSSAISHCKNIFKYKSAEPIISRGVYWVGGGGGEGSMGWRDQIVYKIYYKHHY